MESHVPTALNSDSSLQVSKSHGFIVQDLQDSDSSRMAYRFEEFRPRILPMWFAGQESAWRYSSSLDLTPRNRTTSRLQTTTSPHQRTGTTRASLAIVSDGGHPGALGRDFVLIRGIIRLPFPMVGVEVKEMEKIRMAVSALGIYVLSVASASVVAASSTSLQARSAEELAKYVAANGAAVAC